MRTVSWRQTVAALLAALIGFSALVVVFSSDGLPAVDAVASRATRWFVHQQSGRVVLADGYGGRAIASLDVDAEGNEFSVVEGGAGAYVVISRLAQVRSIDSANLRLGPEQGVVTLGDNEPLVGVGASGLVVADPDRKQARLLPLMGESVGFEADISANSLVGPDGSIWSIVESNVVRITSAGTTSRPLEGADAQVTTLSLVGNEPLIVDRGGRRARLGDGPWQSLPTDDDASEIVAQQPGPGNECGWVAAGDDLWCIGNDGIDVSANVSGLDVDGSDLLAIAGDAAALVRRGPTEIVRFDWREGKILNTREASISGTAVPVVSSTVDLVWVDDADGQFVWAINPWGIEAIDKNDGRTLEYGQDGEIVNDGDADGGSSDGIGDGAAEKEEEREPDNNGIDDPPVAIDDPVTSRAGRAVTVPVTTNDYDPDGEAIAVVDVGTAGHGSVEILSASTVVFNPEPGYVGLDEFTYTIADGDGTEASANVIVQLIPIDGTNQPPIGAPDSAETGAGVPVVIDVLLNDIDPDRDPLAIELFDLPAGIGAITKTTGPSGLRALKYQPLPKFEGTAEFSYRPIDSFGALGEDVTVTVEVAREGDANRPPIVRPDSIRLRRGAAMPLAVLVNDEDPDGDKLTLDVPRPVPEGLSVEVAGEQLNITALTGSPTSVPFEYTVDDGHGHLVTGFVLVGVIDDIEPNRPPLVVADAGAAVVGRTIEIDVLANDSDPDGDPLVIVDATEPDSGRGRVVILGDRIQFTPAPIDDDGDAIARFTYTVDDGNRHRASGDITVTVLPEPLPEAPYAKDDSTFTFVDQPVSVDVLRNDGDPSGERPRLTGIPSCPSGGRAVITADDQVRFTPPSGQTGAFRCTYTVTNSSGLSDTASLIVSVREPQVTNRPPVANLDSLTVDVGSTTPIDVTANDEDPDGDNRALAVVSSTSPSLGSATRNGNTITFTAGTTAGQATINYQVADAQGAVSLGRLSITIQEPVNDRPIATDDARIIPGPGTPTSFDVVSNDFDPNEPRTSLRVVSAEMESGDGTLSRSGSILTISPNPSFVGVLVATYTIEDSGGLTATAKYRLTVLEPVNRPPVAVDDSNEVANGGTVTTPVLFNDSDPDGDPLTMTITSGPASNLGQATTNGTSITFAATPGAAGTAVIEYSLSDGQLSDSASLRINVLPCAQSAPSAQSAFLATGYQQPISVNLASYASNGTVTDVVAPPGYGGGVYTPPAGENGNVTISYAVVNSCRQRATGQITIDVNRDPVPQAVSASLGRQQTREFPVSNLAGDDEPLTITSSTGAPAWVVTESTRVVVSPTLAVAAGTYSWTTRVADPGGLAANVPMSITVTNSAPIANNDAVNAAGGSVSAALLSNDSDPDGTNGGLRIQQIPSTITFSNGETGTISLSADQRNATIDPRAGLGSATFTYTAVDPDGAVSAPATVTVTGPKYNKAPIANSQTINVVAGQSVQVVLDVSDPDGDPLTVIVVDNSQGVGIALSGTTATVKAPSAGTFTATYRVTDGSLQSNVATLTVIASSPPTTTTTTTTTTLPATTTTDHSHSTTIPPHSHPHPPGEPD